MAPLLCSMLAARGGLERWRHFRRGRGHGGGGLRDGMNDVFGSVGATMVHGVGPAGEKTGLSMNAGDNFAGGGGGGRGGM